MDRVGCDMCLDVHGDETLPYNFILGAEAVPAWNAGPRLKTLQDTFCAAYQQVQITARDAYMTFIPAFLCEYLCAIRGYGRWCVPGSFLIVFLCNVTTQCIGTGEP